jgi:Fe-S cluster biogenesis protein NfuA
MDLPHRLGFDGACVACPDDITSNRQIMQPLSCSAIEDHEIERRTTHAKNNYPKQN